MKVYIYVLIFLEDVMRKFFMPNNIYAFISLYVIPIFTIIIASKLSWTESNLSIIGNYYDSQKELFIWGILVAFFILFFMHNIFDRISYKDLLSEVFLYGVCLLILLAVTTPYLPDQFPVKSKFHEGFAFFIPIAFSFLIFRFLRFLHNMDKKYFMIFWIYLLIIVIISILMLSRHGYVTSLLEIFVTLSICYFIRFLDIKISEYISKD